MAKTVINDEQKAHVGELTPPEKALAEVPEIFTSTNSLSSGVAPEEALKQQPRHCLCNCFGCHCLYWRLHIWI